MKTATATKGGSENFLYVASKTIRSRKTIFGEVRWMQFQREENKEVILLLDRWLVKSQKLRVTSLKSEVVKLTKLQFEFAFDILLQIRRKVKFRWQIKAFVA